MMGGSVLVSFSEHFDEQGCEVGESEKSEISVHVIIIDNFINQIVGPRIGSSSSHVREGKDNSFPRGRKFCGSCFKIKPELANERFGLVEVSSENIRGIGFELLVNNDRWCRRCWGGHRRRYRWWRHSCWIDQVNLARKVLRFKHSIDRFGLDSKIFELGGNIFMS